MTLGVPVPSAVGVGTSLGMSTMPGLSMGATGLSAGDPTSAALGLAATATPAAPPIATECLLISNMFDPNKLVFVTSLTVDFFHKSVSCLDCVFQSLF